MLLANAVNVEKKTIVTKVWKQPIKGFLKKIQALQNIQLLLKLCSFYTVKISISINANHVTNKKIEIKVSLGYGRDNWNLNSD